MRRKRAPSLGWAVLVVTAAVLVLPSCQAAASVVDGVVEFVSGGGDDEAKESRGPVADTLDAAGGFLSNIAWLLIVLAFLAPSPAKLLAKAVAAGVSAPFRLLGGRVRKEPGRTEQ